MGDVQILSNEESESSLCDFRVVLDHDETRPEDLLLMEMRAEELGASVEDASDVEAFQN